MNVSLKPERGFLAIKYILRLSLLFVLSACANIKKSDTKNSPAPEKLTAQIGGFLGPTYRVTWRDGALIYFADPAGKGSQEQILKPTAEQWHAFHKALQKLKMEKWKKEYKPRGLIADGTQWEVEIVWDDFHIKSHGDNAYPNQKDFAEFLESIKNLVDQRRFE